MVLLSPEATGVGTLAKATGRQALVRATGVTYRVPRCARRQGRRLTPALPAPTVTVNRTVNPGATLFIVMIRIR